VLCRSRRWSLEVMSSEKKVCRLSCWPEGRARGWESVLLLLLLPKFIHLSIPFFTSFPLLFNFFSNLFNFILFLSYHRLSYQSSIFLFSVNPLLCLGNPIRSLCFIPYGFNYIFQQSLHAT